MEIIRSDRETLELKASQIISDLILDSDKDNISIALPGGRSVSGILGLLKGYELPWHKLHFFMVDERLVPLTDKDSNFNLLKMSIFDDLISLSKIRSGNIHPFNFSNNIDVDIKRYNKEFLSISDTFDIVLLSSGEDGHVASLFPNHKTINSSDEYFIYTLNSPKPPRGRMSASKKLLSKAKSMIVLFFGNEKKKAYENYNNPHLTVDECPAKIVKEIENSYLLTDIK